MTATSEIKRISVEEIGSLSTTIHELHQEVFGKDSQGDMFTSIHEMWIAQDLSNGAKVIGFACVAISTDLEMGWYLSRLAVSTDHRKEGIGTRLLQAVQGEAKDAGVVWLSTRTYPYWKDMRKLLQKHQWVFADAREGKHRERVSERWIFPLAPRPAPVVLVGANPHGRGGELFHAVNELKTDDGLPLLNICGVVDSNSEHLDDPMYLDYEKSDRLENLSGLKNAKGALLAVPHHAYDPIRNTCLEFKLGLFHEKPLAISLPELLSFHSKLEQNPVPLVVGLQRRNHPTYVFLRHQIHSEQVKAMTLDISLGLKRKDSQNDWRNDPKQAGGGALIDIGYHAIDLVQYLLNAPFEPLSIVLSRNGHPLSLRPTSAASCIESKAVLLGKCGRTWVRVNVDRCGTKKSECVNVETDKSIWSANRKSVKHNGLDVLKSFPSWEMALQGRLAVFAAALSSPLCLPDLWDHLSILKTIDKAYSLARTNRGYTS